MMHLKERKHMSRRSRRSDDSQQGKSGDDIKDFV